jgi:hypothetical protein
VRHDADGHPLAFSCTPAYENDLTALTALQSCVSTLVAAAANHAGTVVDALSETVGLNLSALPVVGPIVQGLPIFHSLTVANAVKLLDDPTQITAAVTAGLAGVPLLGVTVAQVVSTVVATLTADVQSTLAGDLPLSFAELIPVLAHPGVRVTLAWLEQGPMDGVLSGTTDGRPQGATSTAQRRFKNLVVLPAVHDDLIGEDATYQLTGALSGAANDVLTGAMSALTTAEGPLDAALSALGCPPLVQEVVDDYQGDLGDLLTASSQDASLLDTLQNTVDAGEYVTVLTMPSYDQLPTPLSNAAFLSFVPMCLPAGSNVAQDLGIGTTPPGVDYAALTDTSSCTTSAEGGFRAELVRP